MLKRILLISLILFSSCERMEKYFFQKMQEKIENSFRKEKEISENFLNLCSQSKWDDAEKLMDDLYYTEKEKKVFFRNLKSFLKTHPITVEINWPGKFSSSNNHSEKENGRQTFYLMGFGNRKKDTQFIDVLIRSNPTGELKILGVSFILRDSSKPDQDPIAFGSESALKEMTNTNW